MRTLFSLRLDDEHVDIFEALTVVLRDAERRIWSPFSPPRWLPVRRNREVRDALRTLDSFVFDLIDKRRAERERVPGAEAEGDLLDALLDNRGDRPARQACEKVKSQTLAGQQPTDHARPDRQTAAKGKSASVQVD